jgi:hypothetical protein
MKENVKHSMLKFAWLFIAAMVAFTACKKDDDPDPIIPVEDGMYIKGAVTPFAELEFKGMFDLGKNEVGQEMRTGMFEKYVTIQSGTAGFNIVTVAGSTVTTWGPATVETIDLAGEREQPNITVQKGTLGTTGKFTVPSDGLYHIIVDVTSNKFVIAPVPFWAILGGATANGWSDSQMPLAGSFSMDQVTYEITGFVLRAGDFKLRYGGGWKIEIDGDLVKANTNFGGAISGTLPNLTSTLVPGGENYSFPEANEGAYTVKLTWTKDDGFTSSFTKTADVEPLPEYPEAMYLVGAATAYGWDAPGTHEDAIMHKVAGGVGNEGIYWKILHLEGGAGFKLAAANWGNPNLGFADVDVYDPDGVTVSSADGNMSVATSGMYMIVLDLRNDEIKLSIKAPEVYGMGDAFGGWTADVPANKFTVDNTEKTLISPALTATANVRMYVDHSWIGDWWQAEFVLVGGDIVYRNNSNDDPPAFPGTAGQVITLHFDDNTGSIAK